MPAPISAASKNAEENKKADTTRYMPIKMGKISPRKSPKLAVPAYEAAPKVETVAPSRFVPQISFPSERKTSNPEMLMEVQ